MVVKLKHIENAVADDGSLARGALYQTDIAGLTGGNAGHRYWESGTTKLYALGTRMTLPDGRVFRYAKAGNTLIVGQGAHNYETENYVRYVVLPAAVSAGAKTFSITVDTDDGSRALHDGALDVDELQGGYIVIFDTGVTNHVVIRRILTNTAIAVGGGDIVITIDEPIPLALTVLDAVAAMCSPYLNVQSNSSEDMCFVGVPTVPATVGEYFWLQTWGVCWIASAAGVGTGINVHNSYFGGNGALLLHSASDNAQHAGFMISSRARGGAQGETFIMLQISI